MDWKRSHRLPEGEKSQTEKVVTMEERRKKGMEAIAIQEKVEEMQDNEESEI